MTSLEESLALIKRGADEILVEAELVEKLKKNKSLRVKATAPNQINYECEPKNQKWMKAFNLGFITNVLNPKATLFFLSIFSVVVSQETPNLWLSVYAVYLSLATMVWFCLVSLILSRDKIRNKFLKIGHYFDWLMGVVLIALAVNVAFSSL